MVVKKDGGGRAHGIGAHINIDLNLHYQRLLVETE
jgi:hypothetical protein